MKQTKRVLDKQYEKFSMKVSKDFLHEKIIKQENSINLLKENEATDYTHKEEEKVFELPFEYKIDTTSYKGPNIEVDIKSPKENPLHNKIKTVTKEEPNDKTVKEIEYDTKDEIEKETKCEIMDSTKEHTKCKTAKKAKEEIRRINKNITLEENNGVKVIESEIEFEANNEAKERIIGRNEDDNRKKVNNAIKNEIKDKINEKNKDENEKKVQKELKILKEQIKEEVENRINNEGNVEIKETITNHEKNEVKEDVIIRDVNRMNSIDGKGNLKVISNNKTNDKHKVELIENSCSVKKPTADNIKSHISPITNKKPIIDTKYTIPSYNKEDINTRNVKETNELNKRDLDKNKKIIHTSKESINTNKATHKNINVLKSNLNEDIIPCYKTTDPSIPYYKEKVKNIPKKKDKGVRKVIENVRSFHKFHLKEKCPECMLSRFHGKRCIKLATIEQTTEEYYADTKDDKPKRRTAKHAILRDSQSFDNFEDEDEGGKVKERGKGIILKGVKKIIRNIRNYIFRKRIQERIQNKHLNTTIKQKVDLKLSEKVIKGKKEDKQNVNKGEIYTISSKKISVSKKG